MNFLALGYFGYFFNKTFCTEKYKIPSILYGFSILIIIVVMVMSHENTLYGKTIHRCMENPYLDVWIIHTVSAVWLAIRVLDCLLRLSKPVMKPDM